MNTLVIGVGNEWRGDDAIGLIVARHIRELNLPQVEVMECDGEGTRLMECWKAAQCVILIDAVCSGAMPGAIHRFVVHEEPLSANLFPTSTHAFGVAEAIELSKALGHLPPRFVVFGIEGRDFAIGAKCTESVKSAIAETIRLVQQQIQ